MQFDFWTGYWTFTAFVFGAITGSFLNVCVWRLPRGESLHDPPSHCPNCNHRLRILPDMVPLFSQLWTRSRCRYCGAHYSWRYFWVEIFTAVAFAAIYLRYVTFGPEDVSETVRTWSAIAGMTFAGSLVAIFFIDLEHYVIPDLAIGVALAAGIAKDLILIVCAPHAVGARHLWQPLWGTPWSVPVPLSILAGLLAFWLLWQFAALSTALLGREAMGAGDSLLLAAMAPSSCRGRCSSWPSSWPSPSVPSAGSWASGSPAVGRTPSPSWKRTADHRKKEIECPDGAQASGPDAVFSAARAAPLEETAYEAASAPEAGQQPLFSAAHRGMLDVPPAVQEELGAPELPPASRWGRLWTVLGTWVAAGGLCAAGQLAAGSPALAAAAGGAAALAALGLIVYGSRRWLVGDREWLPQMDAFFDEGEVGPRFIPFGPYLVAGTLIAMLFGRPIIEWYAVHMLAAMPAERGGAGVVLRSEQ